MSQIRKANMFSHSGSRLARVVTATALGLGTLSTSIGLAGTLPVAEATPSGPAVGTHIPATALTARQLAAEPCYVGTADDSVLLTLRSVANSRAVSAKVRLAVFETAWVESHANSLPCGDADSRGVFQQRPSMGWGSSSQVQSPSYAVGKFLSGNSTAGAIAVAAAHPTWTAGQISQQVQGSAYPSRYDQAQATAQALITRSNNLASGAIAAGHYSWPNVQYGEHNNRVQTLQYLLNQHGAALSVDGIFGANTKAAARAFQTRSGLSSDGIVGAHTWASLIVNLHQGSTGNAVKALQHELNLHGSNLVVDGIYGAGTNAAVASFRRAHKLPAGSVDASVWNTLISIYR